MLIILSIRLNLHFLPQCKLHLQSDIIICKMVLSMPSFLFKLLLSTCKTVLRISFLSILIFFFNLQDGSLCFFSLRIFFLRCRWQDGRYHLTDMLLLYLPWKYHLLVVLHHAFCGFNHDTSGWFSTYFHGMKRCTDVAKKCDEEVTSRIASADNTRVVVVWNSLRCTASTPTHPKD